jgi:uncharacterized membrane protein YkvA (DUF1232 family)
VYLGVKLLSNLNRAIAFLAHAWGDRRVPLLARILLLIIPLYVIAPNDLIPDSLPYGFVDDFLIFVCLTAIAHAIVPRGVFIDARKAAACGIVLLSVTGSLQSNGHFASFAKTAEICAEKFVAAQTKPIISARPAFSNQAEQKISVISAFLDQTPRQHLEYCVFQAIPELVMLSHSAEFDSALLSGVGAKLQSPSPAGRMISLITRGGQCQLFGSGDDSRHPVYGLFRTFVLSPSSIEGGIFVALAFNKLNWKDYHVS